MPSNYANMEPYSLGICAVNKPLNTDIIEAYPVEKLPMYDGELVDAEEQHTATIVDSFGRSKSITTTTGVTLKCKYKSNDPNRLTSPDIRRGAYVQIYKQNNSDTFYWEPYTNTNNYQKLETVINGFSDTKEENQQPNESNTWTQGVSTHEKKVNIIHTTKSDKEKWSYDINIDVAAGIMMLMDDIGNYIKLDSGGHLIRFQNADGTFLELNKKQIEWGCETYVGNASKSMEETTPKKTGTYNNSLNTNSPIHNHAGNYSILGGITSAPGGFGGSSGSGMKMNGTGTITNGDLIADGISLKNHTHQGAHGRTSKPIAG